MFRLEETIVGGWQEKTMEAMRRRRFDAMVGRMPPMSASRLETLTPREFSRRIEGCWQDIERKPMRSQQIAAVKKGVLTSVQLHADYLSDEEHALVERALILGGSARIEDAQELEAAHALSLRLWGNTGLVSGMPYIELSRDIMEPAAKAMDRDEHEEIRFHLKTFSNKISEMLYCQGALDDRLPQRMLIRDVMKDAANSESMLTIARRYLWSSFDCIDYGGDVVLLHPALAEPCEMTTSFRRVAVCHGDTGSMFVNEGDIFTQEIPLQDALERSITGAMRAGMNEKEIARDIRYLCKQNAPLSALEEILQQGLIVLMTTAMRTALVNMFYMTPKWTGLTRGHAYQ